MELDTPKTSAQTSEWSCNIVRPPEIQGGGRTCHQLIEEIGKDSLFF